MSNAKPGARASPDAGRGEPACVVFGAETLLPESWQRWAAEGPVRTFNPGLLRDTESESGSTGAGAGGWIFAYRIVAADGLRRIGICRLDRELRVVEGSCRPLTDEVRFRPDGVYPEIGTTWFADPRLYRFGGRVFVYWNSGWHEPRNCQFVQELDPVSLRPRGFARELVLRGERQKLEKNWTIFADERGEPRAVYSIAPHRVLAFSFEGEGDIVFEETARVDWTMAREYPASHGGLRGGAPPCFADGMFWSFGHSVHDGANGYRYAPAVYAFAPRHPFAPTLRPVRPIALGNPFGERRTHERLNPAVGEVIYPCGAAYEDARWWVSHGINDEYCAISILPHAAVLETLAPVAAPP